MDVLQIDGVINNGVSFYNSYQIMISQEFATGVGTYDTTRNFVVKSFQDLVNVALEEGLAGAIGYARVKAHATLVVRNSSYSLCSQCPSPLLPGIPGTPVLILGCFPSFNTSCALN